MLFTGVLLGGERDQIAQGPKELIVSKFIGGEGQVGRQVWGSSGPVGVAQPCRGTNQLVVRPGLWGIINFDGAVKDNPGKAGCGATLRERNPPGVS